jgi:teichoic acid transport system permease protein
VDNSGRGQISAPGNLESGATIAPDAPKVPDQDLGELAAFYGLKLSGARPSLPQYIVTLWQRRHFIVGYATARNVSMYTEAKLGQVWQVLTPILNACVYYLIFGLLFDTARAVDHFPAFLVVGVFVFAFTERSIVTGSTVMRTNIQLIRALYFPRASLPLAYVIVELQQMLLGMGVVTIVMLVSGQYPSWYWLLIIPAVILQTMFNTGAALIVARMGGAVADVSELIPFILRISRYFCGVMYLIITVTYHRPLWVQQVLSLNPLAVYISLVRVGFMSSYRSQSAGNLPFNQSACSAFINDAGGPLNKTQVAQLAQHGVTTLNGGAIHVGTSNIQLQAFCHAIVTNNDLWIAAAGWGVVAFVVGIVFFWQAESVYGRG